jgi:hypothetical protein
MATGTNLPTCKSDGPGPRQPEGALSHHGIRGPVLIPFKLRKCQPAAVHTLVT